METTVKVIISSGVKRLQYHKVIEKVVHPLKDKQDAGTDNGGSGRVVLHTYFSSMMPDGM